MRTTYDSDSDSDDSDDVSDDSEVKQGEDPFFTLALAARYNRPHCNN